MSSTVDKERQTLHVLDGVKRIAMVETLTIDDGDLVTTPDPKQRYQLGNHLGSALLELDETGLIVSYEEYAPFGASAYRSARSGVEVTARRYRYVGMERDDETGLYLMGARYYACWLGRWTSADPMGIGADGPGLYNYTRGSPVTLSDPSGREGIGSDEDAAAQQVRRERTGPSQSGDKAALQAKLESIDFSRHAQPAGKTFNPSQPSPSDYETGALDPQFETDTQAEAIKGFAGGFATVAGKTASFIIRSLTVAPMYRGDSVEEQEAFAEGMNAAVTVNPDPRYEIAASITVGVAVGDLGPSLGEAEGGPVVTARPATSEEELIVLTHARAEEIIATQGRNPRGAILSGVRDTATGDIFFDQNAAEISPNLHPILEGRLAALLERTGGEGLGFGTPGTHSEINALNSALQSRTASGSAVTEASLAEFQVYNVRLRGPLIQEPRIPCPNCRTLSAGVQYLDP